MFRARPLQNARNRHVRILAQLGFAMVVPGCGPSPTIASIDKDEVRVQANGANLEQARAKAQEACNLQKRTARLTNFRCEDRYCFQGTYVFVCRPTTDA
jgi:hypothetical protein